MSALAKLPNPFHTIPHVERCNGSHFVFDEERFVKDWVSFCHVPLADVCRFVRLDPSSVNMWTRRD